MNTPYKLYIDRYSNQIMQLYLKTVQNNSINILHIHLKHVYLYLFEKKKRILLNRTLY